MQQRADAQRPPLQHYYILNQLVNFQPLTNTFQCIAYRFQCEYKEYIYSQQHPVLSEVSSTYRAVRTYFFTPKPLPKQRLPLLGSTSVLFIVSHSLIESLLYTSLSTACLRFLFPTHPVVTSPPRLNHLHRQPDHHPIHTYTHVCQLMLCKSIFYSIVAPLSHPFSILRTITMVTGDLPCDSISSNLSHVSPFNPNNLYASSVLSHLLTGYASIFIGDTILYYVLEKYDSLVPGESEDEVRRNGQQLTVKGVNKVMWTALLNFAATFVTRCIIYPLTVIQTRLEMQGMEGAVAGTVTGEMGKSYGGIVECVKAVMARSGLRGLYRGFGAHALVFIGQGLWVGAMFLLARGAVQYRWFEGEEGEGEEEQEQNVTRTGANGYTPQRNGTATRRTTYSPY